jgi:hypothetical protein
MNLAEARRIVRRAEREQDKREEKASREGAKKLIGKHFKYDNGGDGRRRWWLYVKVLDISTTYRWFTRLVTLNVQALNQDKESPYFSPYFGDIQIEVHGRHDARGGSMGDNYIPITEEEFREATDEIFRMIGLVRREDE